MYNEEYWNISHNEHPYMLNHSNIAPLLRIAFFEGLESTLYDEFDWYVILPLVSEDFLFIFYYELGLLYGFRALSHLFAASFARSCLTLIESIITDMNKEERMRLLALCNTDDFAEVLCHSDMKSFQCLERILGLKSQLILHEDLLYRVCTCKEVNVLLA